MKKQFIYTDSDMYDESSRAEYQEMKREINDEPEYIVSDEEWYDYCTSQIEDERDNLNVPVDGVIIAFADLGLWNGRRQGYKIIGTNVSDILSSSADSAEWFGDSNNIRSTQGHHDGTNHILYRVAKDMDTAERICDKIYNQEIDEEGFRKRTKSLYPYVANVYGWKSGKFNKKKSA